MHPNNQQPYMPPPPRNKKTARNIMLIILGVVALFVVGCSVLVGVAAKDAKNTKIDPAVPPTISASPADSSSPDPSSSPEKPDVTGTGTCDVDLGSTMGSDYSLTAEVDLHNGNGIPNKVAVLVSWPQYGHSPVGDGKVVTVPAHGDLTVNFAKHVGQSEIDRAQTYEEKHDFSLDCKYTVIPKY